MTRTLILAAMLAALPVSAMAQAERLTDAGYLTASRCVAYAEAAQLQGDSFNVAALREVIDTQGRSRARAIRTEARSDARDIRRQTARAEGASDIARLRERRDQSCRAYVQNGLVQASGATPSS